MASRSVPQARQRRGTEAARSRSPGNTDQPGRLLDQVPDRYRAVIWLGAGQGLRLGEALGMEAGARCADPEDDVLHVVQQLQYAPLVFEGGFYLTEPKAGSSGDVDLDPLVKRHLAAHVAYFPPVDVDLVGKTAGLPVRRTVQLLFTTTHGNPFTDRVWSREWVKWRDAAGWPYEEGGFHALRHYYATTLITNHAEPQDVQRLLRHKTLRYTLETYVGWWPKRRLIGSILTEAAAKRAPP